MEECKSDAADTHEFNLWTAPDCAGTEYETSNRTWFYFSVATPHNFSGRTLRYDLHERYKTNLPVRHHILLLGGDLRASTVCKLLSVLQSHAQAPTSVVWE